MHNVGNTAVLLVLVSKRTDRLMNLITYIVKYISVTESVSYVFQKEFHIQIL